MNHRVLLGIGAAMTSAAALVVACSASKSAPGVEDGSGGEGGSGAGGSGGSPTVGVGGGGGATDCSDDVRNIFLISNDNRLFSFDPEQLQIDDIGVIDCATQFPDDNPFSMAVDRGGTAWVLFDHGNIFHVDVKTAACTATSYQRNQDGWYTFGMGFVSDTPTSESETLFVADYLGYGIARIDTESLELSLVGPYDQMVGGGELTGTGDSRLFALFYEGGLKLAEIERTSGDVLSNTPLPSLAPVNGFAFAFWGGDFWLFTDPLGSTQIDQYRPSNGALDTVVPSLGTIIVGAGVSTCAPVVPPR